jgi:4-hydroxybenzoate polyprenyltransferase
VQWSKNAIVFAGMVFGGVTSEPGNVARAFATFIAFCVISSAVYILNDWIDRGADRLHPTKRFRPLAAGTIDPHLALVLAGILAGTGLTIAGILSWWLLLVLATYLGVMVAYCLVLKDVVIVDVFVIATGFVLRAVAGAVVVGVPISAWLLLCTMLLALFLGFGKRRSELVVLSEESRIYRQTLQGYTVPMLDQAIAVTAASTIMAYSTYTFNSADVPGNDTMMITIPFVAFAMFRYLYLAYDRKLGASPESLLFRDLPLFASIVCWAAAAMLVLIFR